jgi:TM2 domain-containing membrane protein YozV
LKLDHRLAIALSAGSLFLLPAFSLADVTKTTETKAEAPKASEVKVEEKKMEEKKEDKKSEMQVKEAAQPSKVGHKSPGLATILAIFPGTIFHGAGHMYAGSWIKGVGLLVIGTAGALVAYNQYSAGYNDIQNLMSSSSGGIPEDLSGAYGRLGPILVGTMAFLWSGWDDMAGAGIAAEEYNRKLDQSLRTQIQIVPRDGGAQVALSTHF